MAEPQEQTHAPSPTLHTVSISDLRPTQMTVGMREVEEKRKAWRGLDIKKSASFLGRHMIPVVRGPKDRLYVVDHHHLARALHDEGVDEVLTSTLADLRALEKDEFWTFLDNRNWLHPFDAEGVRHSHDALPRRVSAMKDDPYRSLAGELRRAGGYAKDNTPYSEFLWADFLRRKISTKVVEENFAKAMEKSLELAKSMDAVYLPGWCGPASDG